MEERPDKIFPMSEQERNGWICHFRNLFNSDPDLYSASDMEFYLQDNTIPEKSIDRNEPVDFFSLVEEWDTEDEEVSFSEEDQISVFISPFRSDRIDELNSEEESSQKFPETGNM